MSEKDISTQTAAEPHGKHHGVTGPDGHSSHGDTHKKESTHEHEDDKHGHHEEDN
jgi:hypothetical protein